MQATNKAATVKRWVTPWPPTTQGQAEVPDRSVHPQSFISQLGSSSVSLTLFALCKCRHMLVYWKCIRADPESETVIAIHCVYYSAWTRTSKLSPLATLAVACESAFSTEASISTWTISSNTTGTKKLVYRPMLHAHQAPAFSRCDYWRQLLKTGLGWGSVCLFLFGTTFDFRSVSWTLPVCWHNFREAHSI